MIQKLQSRTVSRRISWLYLFLGGFLVGTLVMNLWRSSFLEEMDLLNTSAINRLTYLEVDSQAFFGYVLRERLGMAVLLCLMATTCIGVAAMAVYMVWMGAMAGMFLSVAAIRYGLKGILLVLAGIVPHYLLLVPACIMLLNWCYSVCVRLYYPHRDKEVFYGNAKQYKMKKFLQLMIILLVVIIGCLLESYVNPILFSNFLKFFYF